jgi:hypothetical protein
MIREDSSGSSSQLRKSSRGVRHKLGICTFLENHIRPPPRFIIDQSPLVS